MTERHGPLAGVLVVERAGRLAVAACAHLLAALGALVVRIETAGEARHALEAGPATRRLMQGGKEVATLPPEGVEAERVIAAWLAAADVVLLEPLAGDDARSGAWGSVAEGASQRAIVCMVSPAGLGQADLPLDANDVLIQAACGLMAVTGESEEHPQHAHVPVTELTGAVVGLTAVLAALRVRRRDGVCQLIDLSLTEAMADQLRTHVALVGAGRTRGFRIGCRHPLCSPWNVYRARDGWVMICSASDQNWRAILTRIGRDDLQNDERYARAADRARHSASVDALMQEWIAARDIEDVVAIMTGIDVPAGPALDARQVAGDSLLRDCGTVQVTQGGVAPRLAFRLSRAPLAGLSGIPAEKPLTPTPLPKGEGFLNPALPKGEEIVKRAPEGCPPSPPGRRVGDEGKFDASAPARLPLEGIRVVELTRYAAGPLAGYLLSSLGAEVIKIEPPGGEETRTWKPHFGKVSGYFANFNAGKRFVSLDLKRASERERLRELIVTADVLLHNMRPGAMERLGFGADVLTADFPKLVYCAISGYGLQGPKLAAFDTVIQGRLGLTALVGEGQTPVRIGYSIADQLAGHYAAAGIVAALVNRDATGTGQVVDVSMADSIAWLTHLAWSEDETRERAGTCRVRAADGWVMASAEADAVNRELHVEPQTLARSALVRALERRGIAAAAVLEVDEVLQQPALRARRSVYDVISGGARAPVFVAPFGLTATPVRRAQAVGDVAQDNESLLDNIEAV